MNLDDGATVVDRASAGDTPTDGRNAANDAARLATGTVSRETLGPSPTEPISGQPRDTGRSEGLAEAPSEGSDDVREQSEREAGVETGMTIDEEVAGRTTAWSRWSTGPASRPADPDEQRRAALVESLPPVTEDTPVLAELHLDTRRRIELEGRRFPKPDATRIITVANQKGGVGKTTTTVNLAAALAQSGLTVLVLDNDPQGNASTALGVEHRTGTPSIYEVLIESAPMQEAVQESPDVPGLFCVPATIDLSGAEIELVSMVARETRLRTALDHYLAWRTENGMERVDYVLVDCPPSLGLLTVNAFAVGREVLIPIQCEYYALEGLSQLLKTIDLIRSHLNPTLDVSTILLTMYDARTNLAQQVAEEVRNHFPDRTLRTTVPRSVRISEAPSYGQTVMTYDPSSSGALAYLEAARELAERGSRATVQPVAETPAVARQEGDVRTQGTRPTSAARHGATATYGQATTYGTAPRAGTPQALGDAAPRALASPTPQGYGGPALPSEGVAVPQGPGSPIPQGYGAGPTSTTWPGVAGGEATQGWGGWALAGEEEW
jgi:chromosome partitioning protein